MRNSYSSPPPGLRAGARVWAYLRDSGGPSQEQSIDQQEKEIIAYCKRYGLVLDKIFRDIAKSGSSTEKRDEFNLMIAQSEDKKLRPDGILIYDLARFARNSIDANYFKSKLRRNQIIIHSIKDRIPEDEFAGRIVEAVLDLATEDSRRRTSEYVKRGLKDLVEKGYSPGKPPRGYVAVKITIGEKRDHTPRIVSKWIPDPVLSDYVKIAWQLRAQGKSYQEITEATHGQLYTGINSWNTFFRNKSYLGIGKSGDFEFADHHEPLISWELWDAVQKITNQHPVRSTGHPNHPRRMTNPAILSGFTFCIECGAMMTHSNGNRNKPWSHYICGRKDRHGVTACKSKRIGARDAETQIVSIVLNQILTPEYLWEVLTETKSQLDSTAELDRRIKAARRQLENLDIAIQRHLNTIERTGSAAAQERLQQREIEKAQTQADLERLELQLATARTEITLEAMGIIVAAWRAQFDQLQESGSVREMKAWLVQFVSRIELGYNRARIFFTYPVVDLLTGGENSGITVSPRGGTALSVSNKSIMVEWS